MTRKIAVLLTTIFIILGSFTTAVFADEQITGYSIDLSTVDSNVKKYLSSLSIDDKNNVYMNNTFVGTVATDPQTFKYATTNYNVSAKISLSSLSCTISVSYTTQKTYQVVLIFDLTDEHDQIVKFYPDYPGSYETSTGTLSGGYYDFGSFSHNYDGTSKSFSVKLNNSTGELYVNGDKTTTLAKGSKNQTVYLEFFQPADDLELDKIGSLPRFNWETASANKRVYTDSQIDSAVSGRWINLHNNKTGLTYDVPLKRTIKIWNRVDDGSSEGEGTYSGGGGNYTAVCEWPEGSISSGSYNSDCSSVTSLDRYWTIYASSYNYKNIDKASRYETKKEQGTKYEYLTYPSSSYTTTSSQPSSSSTRDIQYRYKTRPLTFSDWSTNSCAVGGNIVACDSRTAYAKSTRSWQSWSSWSTDNDCGLFDGSTCDEETRTMYRSRTRSYTAASYGSWSGWSAYAYSLLGCSESSEGGQKTKECQSTTARAFRKIGDWSDWTGYNYDECGHVYAGANDTMTTACMSRTEYRYKSADWVKASYGDWSSWSGYDYSSCEESTTKECSSRTEYRSQTCSTYKADANKCGYNDWVKKSYTCGTSCTAVTRDTYKYECSGKYIVSIGDCKAGQYKRTYSTRSAKTCAAAGCNSWSSWGSWGTTKCTASNTNNCDSRTRYKQRTRSYTAGHWGDYGSYTSWSTDSCPSDTTTTKYSCDSRTRYARRYRSWDSYGDYTLATTYLNNSLYDYKTQTWYSSRSRTYTAASYGDWSNWSNYIYSSCSSETTGGSLTKECNSQTQYRRRYTTDWSAYGSYNILSNSTEYKNCIDDSNCRVSAQTQYRSQTAGDWGSYGNWITWTTSSGNKTNLTNMEYQFRYSDGVADWTQDYGTTKEPGNVYYTGDTKTDLIEKKVSVYVAIRGTTNSLSTDWKQTRAEITSTQSGYASGKAKENIHSDLTPNSYGNIHWSDYNEAVAGNNYSIEYNTASKTIKQASIYVPNLYISAHWRAINKEMAVPAYTSNASLTETIKTNKTINNSGNAKLIPSTRPISRNSKVIYFDYHDPLVNYDKNSSEYQSVETLIEIIETAKLDEKKVIIKMSRADVEDMKEWLDNNNYNTGDDCKFLKQFSYIFDSSTQATITGKCRVGD